MKNVKPKDCPALLAAGYSYLDVRTVEEFEAGHPTGAFNVPVMTRGAMGMQPNAEFAKVVAAKFAKDAQLVVGCQSGMRSQRACDELAAAGFHGWNQAVSDAFDLHVGDDLALADLVLVKDRRVIRGTVLMPDGTPCSNAEVEWTFDAEGNWVGESTQSDGTFLVPPTSDRPVDLCARSNLKVLGDALAIGVAPGTENVVLQLTGPRWIEVLVTDEAGAPIEQYQLGSWLAIGATGTSEWKPRPGGRSRALARARPTFVRVVAEGYVQQERGPFTLADAPDALTIVMPRAAVVRGTVRRDGEAVEGVEVHLSPLLDVPRTRRDGFPQRVGPTVASDRTDADGAFTLGSPQSGRHVVWTQMSDGTRLESQVLELDPRGGLDGIVLDTQRTGTLEGRITTRSGAEGEAAHVILSNGLPWPHAVAVQEGGRFDADGLAPGTWWLRVSREPRNRDELLPEGESIEDATLRSFEIRTQLTTTIEIDLRDVESRVVEGRILLDERAPKLWAASLLADGVHYTSTLRSSAAVQADGSFLVASRSLGGHTLSLRSSGTEARDDRIDAHVAIGARTVHWELATPTGTLDLAGPAGAQRELRIALANGATWVTNFRFDGDGHALLDGLPHAHVELRVPGDVAVRFEATVGAEMQPRFTVP